jgi:hypothetical protein
MARKRWLSPASVHQVAPRWGAGLESIYQVGSVEYPSELSTVKGDPSSPSWLFPSLVGAAMEGRCVLAGGRWTYTLWVADSPSFLSSSKVT